MSRILLVVALAALLFGGFGGAGSRMDPSEGFDRAMFALGDNLDKTAIKPAIQINEAVLPTVMTPGVNNFFANIDDMIIAANDLLQRNGSDLIRDAGRLLVNTTLGVLDRLDVASERNVERHEKTSVRLST